MIRRKKIIKFKNLIRITMILFIILTGTLILSASSSVFAYSADVQTNGAVTWKGHKVGNFTLDGRQAFCVDHAKGQPIS